jgi:predicted transposase YbfD/YdcC
MTAQVIMAVLTPSRITSRTTMPATASLPITPVLSQLHDLVEHGESVCDSQVASLVEVLATVPDPRARRGVRHRLVAVLAMSVCAVLGGMRSFAAIAQWARDSVESCPQLREQLGGVTRAPAESTFRRTLQRLDAAELDRLLGAWAQARTRAGTGMQVLAADGKTLCGSAAAATGDGDAQHGRRHLLAVFDHTHGVVLGQVDVDEKTNEAPMLPTLLDHLDLSGVVITADALHAVRSHARYLHTRGAHYILTIKPNQPALHAQLAALPWAQIPVAHRSTDTGHGRRETRTLKTTAVAAAAGPGGQGLLFPHAAQAIRITRTRTVRAGGKTRRSTETVYAITSLTALHATGEQIARAVRGHWGIENRLHYVRDVTWDEDRSQVRTANGPQVMASLRNLAITILRLTGHTNIAAGLRHHAHNPIRALNALMAS